MRERLKTLLAEYGQAIQARGWKAGAVLIARGELEVPGFRRWAYALGIMLRARELLGDRAGDC